MLKQICVKLHLLFFTLLLLSSCKSKEDKLVHKRIETAIEIGEAQPKQALQILDSIQALPNLDEKGLMLYHVALIRAKRNANIVITSEQAEQIAKAAEYFEKRKDIKNAAFANYYTGVAYEKTNDISKEFSYYLKSYPYAEAIKDSLLMGKIMYNLGSLYFDQKDYDSTIDYLQKVIPLFTNCPEQQLQTYRLLAYDYYLIKDYDNALKYLDEGASLLDKSNDNQLKDLYNSTYGNIYIDLGKYDKAAEYLRKNLGKENTPKEVLRADLNLTDVYTLAHNSDSATYYKNLAEPQLIAFRENNRDDDFLLSFGYKVLRNYYIEQNDKENIVKYMNLHSQKQRELDRTNIIKELYAVNQKINIERIEEDYHEQNSRMLLYTILFVVIFFIVLFMIIYNHLKKKENKIINRKLNEINNLRKELRNMREEKH